jgi:phosphatidylinositol glycan class B
MTTLINARAAMLARLLALRAANALLLRTYFSPDEFWQAPEIAHGVVFGVGAKTWEWAAETHLRSYVHPALLCGPLWLLQLLVSSRCLSTLP